MTRAQELRLIAKELDREADWLAERNPVMHRQAVRERRIKAAEARTDAIALEQKEAA